GRLAHRAGRVRQGLPGRTPGRRWSAGSCRAHLYQAHAGPGQPGGRPHRRRGRPGPGDPRPGPGHLRGRTGQRAGAGRRQPLSREGLLVTAEHTPAAGRALVLGGGGLSGIAWETGILAGLAAGGADVTTADYVLGTSAGATVTAQIGSGLPVADLFDRQTVPALQSAELAPDL